MSSSQVSRAGLTAGAAAAFAATFLFRFLSVQFADDHFVHLSRAQQILLGEVPVRDFFDPGLILQYYASAAALGLSGGDLFGEAILTIAFVAAGAALTFALSARFSGSWVAGAVATMLVVAAFPRLYNYPKVFFYVLALAVAWRYAQPAGGGRVAGLAIVTAVAFLFRHDHAVYIGIAVVVLMAIEHWDRPRQGLVSLGRYAGATAALLLPFFLFIQLTAGVGPYFLGSLPQAQTLTGVRINRLPIRIDRSAPLVTVDAPAELRVNVRWADDLDDIGRQEREARYGLTRPLEREQNTWSYVPADDRPEIVRALIADPSVADTHHIDRQHNRFDFGESFWQSLKRRVPLLRLRGILPGVLTHENALAWFYYVTFVIPFASAIVLVAAVWRGRIPKLDVAVIGTATVLSLVIVQALVRASPDSRLPDVAGPIALLGAWLTGRWLGHGAAGRVSYPRWRRTVAAALWLATLWSAAANADAGAKLSTSVLLSGPDGILGRIAVVTERLRARPRWSWDQSATGLQALTRYVYECTAPTDRLFVTWFQPDVFFYAERAFAGGQVYLHPGWHASPADQQLTVERLERQRVPIVLALPLDERAAVDEDDFAVTLPRRFPVVRDYLYRRYTVAAESSFGGPRVYRVLVDPRLTPTRTYEPLGLPCYR